VNNLFIPPTVVFNPSYDCPLMKEEIFAPILPVIEFEDFNKVLEIIKGEEKSLTMTYCGDINSHNYKRLLEETSSGSILVNCFII